MFTYTTIRALNLSTGEPFTFEVTREFLDLFEHQRRKAREFKSWYLSSEEEAVSYFEFSLFPAFEKVVRIGFSNGFTAELFAEILRDFGITDVVFINKLLEDKAFMSSIQPFFAGITCDGVRAARTLAAVYEATKRLYTEKTDSSPLHPDLL